jgi:hypothetical protein
MIGGCGGYAPERGAPTVQRQFFGIFMLVALA